VLVGGLIQCEIGLLDREMKILSLRCQDGISFQPFRNCHCIRCQYLMMETAVGAETYEIYSISLSCFSERTLLHQHDT
jgi:hypothetical protein